MLAGADRVMKCRGGVETGVYIGQVANKPGAKQLRVQPSQDLYQNQSQSSLNCAMLM